ncbi:MAG: PmbA protein [Silanimonas sp.]|nr:MAG: PmbA protein [Silanimonas sp.]
MTQHAPDDPGPTLDALAELATLALAEARRLGASQAEVAANDERGLNVNVRMGEVESVERTRDRGVAITVYFGKRKAQASTADLKPESLKRTVEMACAIARHTEEDPAAGLADPERLARAPRDFDQWHPWPIEAEAAIELALEAEAAGRAFDPRIRNADGAGVSTQAGLHVYANSHGFLGAEKSTSHSISVALIAGEGEAMQGQHWYSAALRAADLEPAAQVGRKAAERTLARLDPRPAPTGDIPGAVRARGGAQPGGAPGGRGLGRGAVPQGQLPARRRGPAPVPALGADPGASAPAAWLAQRRFRRRRRGHPRVAADRRWRARRAMCSARYSARRLGLESTGNAGGVHNLEVAANAEGFDAMLKGMRRGLVVTELMGQGVNTVTGDYSRGAAGFWVEDGAIAYPVDELTIASNLRDMYAAIEAIGRDIDPRSATAVGSVLVGRMTVAGGAGG